MPSDLGDQPAPRRPIPSCDLEYRVNYGIAACHQWDGVFTTRPRLPLIHFSTARSLARVQRMLSFADRPVAAISLRGALPISRRWHPCASSAFSKKGSLLPFFVRTARFALAIPGRELQRGPNRRAASASRQKQQGPYAVYRVAG
jgi:hypothetical protein